MGVDFVRDLHTGTYQAIAQDAKGHVVARSKRYKTREAAAMDLKQTLEERTGRPALGMFRRN